jgi:hypothetical protein
MGTAGGLHRERRGGSFKLDSGEPMQPDPHDHGLYLRLRVTERELSALDPLTPSQHRQVNHQRRVGEYQLAHVDDHVAVSLDRPCECPPAIPLGRSVLVSSTAQHCGGVIEFDDPGNLQKIAAEGQVATRRFPVCRALMSKKTFAR